jgi:hypothetical protein
MPQRSRGIFDVLDECVAGGQVLTKEYARQLARNVLDA